MATEKASGRITEKALSRFSKKCREDGASGYWPDSDVQGFVVRVRSSSTRFYFRFWFEGKRKEFSIGSHGALTVDQARVKATELAGEVTKGIDPLLQKQACREQVKREQQSIVSTFLEGDYRITTNEENADRVTGRIKKHFPDLLNKPLTSITPWTIELWKKKYSAGVGTLSNGNRILSALRAVFTAALKAGLVDKSPMPEVKNFKVDKNQAIRYLNDSEVARLMAALDKREERQRAERLRYVQHCKQRKRDFPEELKGAFTDYLKPMVIVALNTGMRRGELFNLRLSDIDLPGRLLTVKGSETKKERKDRKERQTKSRQTRQIPINDSLFSTLTTWLNQTGSKGWVFPSPVTGERFDNINSAWEKLTGEAGLGYTLHNLRHTFGTKLAQSRVDLVTIKDLMGHDNLETTSRYLHTNNAMKQSAVALLG